MNEEDAKELQYNHETVEWVMHWLEHKLAVFTPEEKSRLTRMLYEHLLENPGKERGKCLYWADWTLKQVIRRFY